jgi:tetratricopeptide (TPR) repeat protein
MVSDCKAELFQMQAQNQVTASMHRWNLSHRVPTNSRDNGGLRPGPGEGETQPVKLHRTGGRDKDRLRCIGAVEVCIGRPFVLYHCRNWGYFIIFTWMMSGKSDSGKAGAPEGDIRWMGQAVFGMVCALVIGLFAWSAEPGFLELTSPHAKDSYYNLLVQGFRAGQLNVKREAPPGLVQLPNPYNPAVNAAYIGNVYDMSYYKGKLYLYFGVTPALVLFWPYVTLTGHYLSDKDAVVIFFALGFLIAAGLLSEVWRRYFREVSVWVVTVGMLTLGLAVGTQKVLTLWCNIYEVAIICGFAFAMLALAGIWCALHEPKRQVLWLLVASLAYGLAIGSRPSLLFGAIILLIPVAKAWCAATGSGSGRRVGLLLAAAVGPVVLIGLGLMLYNVLRFGNPFEFGWHYQLNEDYLPTTAQQFSLHYLWFNFRFYFLEPMRWSGHFPFLQAVPLSPWPSGYRGMEEPYSGILSNYPVVWLALAAPLAWRGRPMEVVSVLRWFVVAAFLLFAICVLTLCLYFAASSRYESDFLPALMLLAVMGILGLERALVGSPVWRRIARWGWCLLLAYSVVFNLLAGVEAHAEADYFVGNALLNQGRVDEALEHFQKALALDPQSANAHGGLGNALFQKGRMDEAIVEYQKALAIKPNFAEAHNNLGYCFLQIGRMDEAIIQYHEALVLQPKSADACERFGDALFQKGHMDEAIIQYQKALEIKPDFAEAHNNLGYSLLQIGRVDEAIVHYRKAIELQPRFVQAYNNLGNAFRQKRMAAEAMACFQKAIELQPQFIPALKNLVWMLATWPEPSVRNGGKAVALAGQANRFSKDKDPLVLRTLAAAYAEAGRFPEAVATAKQALALAVTQSNTGLTNVLQTEIGLYQTHSPRRSINAVDE